jgi:hypothetical protein
VHERGACVEDALHLGGAVGGPNRIRDGGHDVADKLRERAPGLERVLCQHLGSGTRRVGRTIQVRAKRGAAFRS